MYFLSQNVDISTGSRKSLTYFRLNANSISARPTKVYVYIYVRAGYPEVHVRSVAEGF